MSMICICVSACMQMLACYMPLGGGGTCMEARVLAYLRIKDDSKTTQTGTPTRLLEDTAPF